MRKVTGARPVKAGSLSSIAKDYIEAREQIAGHGVLYHYTSTAGLIGILSAGEIWASSIKHLNDASEFVHTLALADRSSRNALADHGFHTLDRYLIETLRFSHETLSDTACCVASFSEEGDLLSQWRAYCSAGAGYSIGFSTDELRRAAQECVQQGERVGGWRLLPCEYDETNQLAVLKGFLSEAREVFEQLEPNKQKLYVDHMERNRAELVLPWDNESAESVEHPRWITDRAREYMGAVNSVAPAFKASAFREEKEWRIVSPLVFGAFQSEEYRAGKYCPIPYTRFSLPKVDGRLRVSKIIVGPTENPELSFSTVKRICNRYGVDVDSWAISDVPFRHWDSK